MTEPIRLHPSVTNTGGGAKSAAELPEPHSREAEEALLGSVLLYPHKLPEVAALLTAGARDFYAERHQVIFAAIQSLAGDDVVIDPVTVANKLGGDFTTTWAELLALGELAPHPDAALDYARIVADKARRRRDITLARALVHDAYLEPSEQAYSTTRAAFADGVAYDKPAAEGSRFRARSLSDLRKRERAPILDPELRLREDQLLLIYAQENVGKSAYTLYRMTRLAAEGRHVYYVCGEGLSGILDRLDGIIAAHDFDPETVERCFHIVEEAPQFLAPTEIRELIMEALTLDEPIALIVFDTLATTIEGQNENAPEVISAVIGGMRRIMRRLGCAGILVHHSGKDTTRGPRGHSGLRGAVDISVEVTGEEGSDIITLHCKKARYDAKFLPFCYQLRGITLDEYGDRSTVVAFPSDRRPVTASPDAPAAPRITPNDRKMLRVLRSLRGGMKYGAWVAQGWEMERIPAGTAKDSIRRLREAGLVAEIEGMYQPTALADEIN